MGKQSANHLPLNLIQILWALQSAAVNFILKYLHRKPILLLLFPTQHIKAVAAAVVRPTSMSA